MASLNKNKESHGLGLSICKKIAEKLDGDIKVESKLNVGSTFSFSFTTYWESKKGKTEIKKMKIPDFKNVRKLKLAKILESD